MKFAELVADRYSVRRYEANKVEEEKLKAILEAGRVAPSAHNSRPIKLIAVGYAAGEPDLPKSAISAVSP